MEVSATLGGSGKEEKMGIDEALRLHAGEFGRWQMKQFLLTSMALALEAFHTMVMIFADRQPEWTCAAGAGGAACRVSVGGAASFCGLPTHSWEWVGGPVASTVSQWVLICGARYKVGLAQSAFFAGCMVGAGAFGHLSDSFMGRKGALTILCALNAVFGLLTALSPTFWVYAVLRLLTGLSTGGLGLCAFVLATESVGPSKRGVAGMSTFYFFSAGVILLSATASLFKSWRSLYVATSLPSIFFLLVALPFVSESPRWFLLHRKTTEATEILKSIARANGRELPGGVALALDSGDSEELENAVSVVRSPATRVRLVLVLLSTFFCAVAYYGLSLNVVNLNASVYLSVFLNAAAEVPAMALAAALLERLGRRKLVAGTMWLSGVSCLAGAIGTKKFRLVAGVTGIFGVTATYDLLYIYTAELFPTTVRNTALGAGTQTFQLGAILAPMAVVLGEKLPFIVFAACCAAGGVAAIFLPETMNKPLYDTVAGMEEGEGVAGADEYIYKLKPINGGST